MKSKARCDRCGETHEVEPQIGGKVGGAVVGMVAAPVVHQMTQNKLLAAAAGLVVSSVGAAAGHYLLDEWLLPACPECGGVLRVIGWVLA